MLDIDKLRKDSPACGELIHFNNAGSALSPSCVTASVIEHLELEQKLGGYEAAATAQAKIENFYSAFSKLLNCQANEIAWQENSTRAWEMALYSIDWQPGDEIISCETEYVSNYLGLLHLAQQKSLKLITIACDANGQIDLESLEQKITKATKLIAITHIASQRGDIQPVAEVGRIAREHELLFLLDACQSVGQLPLDVEEIGCDFIVGSGRKFLRGPRGTGFLYVREARLAELNPVFVDLHSATWNSKNSYSFREGARRFENWESFVAGKIGLGVAVDYALALDLSEISKRVAVLARELNQRLQQLDRVEVWEQSQDLSGIVTFTKQGLVPRQLQQLLQARGINTSVSNLEHARYDLASTAMCDVNRASVHYYNNEAEIDVFVEAVATL